MHFEDLDDLILGIEQHMKDAVKLFRDRLNTIRNSRVHISMLNGIKINSYGSFLKIDQTAGLSLLDSQTLSIKPWDKSLLKAIEAAISKADLGVTLSSDGDSIMLKTLPMTEEARKKSVIQVKSEIEQAKINIRKIRQDAKDNIKRFVKEEFPEDEIKKTDSTIQKLTDNYVSEIEQLGSNKKDELMKI
ncbi:MAG: ribosome recycling factor [Solitalea-like symbiont of Acarus siro]